MRRYATINAIVSMHKNVDYIFNWQIFASWHSHLFRFIFFFCFLHHTDGNFHHKVRTKSKLSAKSSGFYCYAAIRVSVETLLFLVHMWIVARITFGDKFANEPRVEATPKTIWQKARKRAAAMRKNQAIHFDRE